MDSSSEKNDVVGLDVSRRIPVVCWEARHLAASKSFPSPSSSRACRVTSSMPSIRDPPRANIVKRTTSFRAKHTAEVDVQMNQNLARLKSFSSGHCLVTRPPSVVLNATLSLQNLASSKSLLPAETAPPQQRRRRTAASWQSFLPARRIEVEPLILDVIPITTRMPWVLQFSIPVSPQHARHPLRQRHDARACPDREDVVRLLRNKLVIGVLPRFPTHSSSFDSVPTGIAPSSKTTTCLFRTTTSRASPTRTSSRSATSQRCTSSRADLPP